MGTGREEGGKWEEGVGNKEKRELELLHLKGKYHGVFDLFC